MAKVGFIGTGEIASSMVHGLKGQGHQIFVSERNASFAERLSKFQDVSVASNQSVLDNSEIVILCLLADVARSALPELRFGPDQQVISVMADVSLADLTQWCAPASHFEMTIPLPSVAIGGCPLPCFPDDTAVIGLFGANNPIIPVPSEDALKAHMAVTALASVSFAQTKAAVDWLATVTEDQVGAEQYILNMMAGFYGALPKDGAARLDEALQALSTEGGFNATLRDHMDQAEAPETLYVGLEAFKARLGFG